MGELKQKATQYAEAFDGASELADEAGRARKAAKIRAVLEKEGVYESAQLRILDIGCAYGLILGELTPSDGLGIGVDMDENLGGTVQNVEFVRADAEELPFASGSFNVVVCNHVYEHTDNASKLLSEINRVMSDEAVCYFAGPNRFEPVEPHYGLPFLSWLPRSLADSYMRLSGKGVSYPEKPLSHPQLRRLLEEFRVTDYTREIVEDPVKFNATDILPPGSLKRWIAEKMLRFAPFFFPGFVYVLRKNRHSSQDMARRKYSASLKNG
jgi:SAM-dependent methyltransferase